MREKQRTVVLGSAGGWHERELTRAFGRLGIETACLPVSRLIADVGGDGGSSFGVSLPEGRFALQPGDTVLVRAIPAGSLEQIIYRMDVLHALEDWGCRVINSAETLERCVDKFHASFLIERAGLPTPRTRVAERFDDALALYEELGGDVVVKPLFGSEGRGIIRISDPDLAYRTFRALDVTRSVYYIQEFLPQSEWDLRAFVLGGQVLGCFRRTAPGWKKNVSLGAAAEALP